ncbi:hypothetical protein WI372_13470 [Gemmatimonadota bacterium DH-20]|uniref:Uncharacterized protein n=1 Tax=Gaopeijia maritima TaxID=3119007 RepID=A0ABU9ED00_9BACT
MHDTVTGIRFSAIAAIAILAYACSVGDSRPVSDDAVEPPSDSEFVAVDDIDLGDGSWSDQRTAELYLDADADAEFVTIASRNRGGPAVRGGVGPVGDTRLWAVVAREATGAQTVLYSRIVPQGHIEVVAAEADDGRTGLLILERSPATLRTYRVDYAGPRDVRVERLGEWSLDPNADWYGSAPPPIQVAAVRR